MEAFGDRTGLCTVLRVKFSGWTKKDVQAVVGEGARGWCALLEASAVPGWAEEVQRAADEDSILSSDPASPWLRDERPLMEMRERITEADLAGSFSLSGTSLSATHSNPQLAELPVQEHMATELEAPEPVPMSPSNSEPVKKTPTKIPGFS